MSQKYRSAIIKTDLKPKINTEKGIKYFLIIKKKCEETNCSSYVTYLQLKESYTTVWIQKCFGVKILSIESVKYNPQKTREDLVSQKMNAKCVEWGLMGSKGKKNETGGIKKVCDKKSKNTEKSDNLLGKNEIIENLHMEEVNSLTARLDSLEAKFNFLMENFSPIIGTFSNSVPNCAEEFKNIRIETLNKENIIDNDINNKITRKNNITGENGNVIYETLNQETLNQETQETQEETLTQETLNQENQTQETLNEENQEENLNRETLNQETLNQETLTQETLNEETLNQETLNEETLNEETLNEEILSDEIVIDKVFNNLLNNKKSKILHNNAIYNKSNFKKPIRTIVPNILLPKIKPTKVPIPSKKKSQLAEQDTDKIKLLSKLNGWGYSGVNSERKKFIL